MHQISSNMDKNIYLRGSVQDPLFCLIVFSLVTVGATLVRQLGVSFSSIVIPALWGLGAILPLRGTETELLSLGLKSQEFIKGIKYFILCSLVVFPLYSGAFYLSLDLGLHLPADLIAPGVPILDWILYNFIAVAFFEEFFFRGFLQGRFENYAKRSFSGAGTAIWLPIVASAFLFALAHVAVDLDPVRMVVFFPGLLFGWLRAKTGFLLAPILSHGSANLVSMFLIRSVQ